MKKGIALFAGLAWLALTITLAFADDTVIEMHYAIKDGMGKNIGTVTASQTPYGTLLTPNLSGLSPGLHGFHVHENGSCGPGEKDGHVVPGLAAGGHYDPDGTGAHKGPYADGHLGDLPVLYVDKSGKAEQPMMAPRVKLSDLKGHALMIHANGDNYSDSPKKLGGGGARIACGVAK